METRTILTDSLTVRQDDQGALIEGYGAVYYNPKDKGTQYELWPGTVERIKAGAFDGVVNSGSDVFATFNHSRDNLLGRRGNNTLTLRTDAKGLVYTVRPPDTQVGREVVEMVRRGDLTGSSFGFMKAAEEFEKEVEGPSVRWLTEIELIELGPVVGEAYAATSVNLRSPRMVAAKLAFWKWELAETARILEEVAKGG